MLAWSVPMVALFSLGKNGVRLDVRQQRSWADYLRRKVMEACHSSEPYSSAQLSFPTLLLWTFILCHWRPAHISFHERYTNVQISFCMKANDKLNAFGLSYEIKNDCHKK